MGSLTLFFVFSVLIQTPLKKNVQQGWKEKVNKNISLSKGWSHIPCWTNASLY